MTYRTEFPDFDDDVHPAKAAALGFTDDTSWHNDTCPSFTCDVFVLFIDYADLSKREHIEAARFSIQDQGESVLETDDWDDVRAYVEDGRRDFPPYAPTIERLTAEYEVFLKREGLDGFQGDAMEILIAGDLSQYQRVWISDFVQRWDAAEARSQRA